MRTEGSHPDMVPSTHHALGAGCGHGARHGRLRLVVPGPLRCSAAHRDTVTGCSVGPWPSGHGCVLQSDRPLLG